MKLKELLKVIPDYYEIGLTTVDDFGDAFDCKIRDDAVMSFAAQKKFSREQVENRTVRAIHPCADVRGMEERGFSSGTLPFCVEPQLLIELERGETDE